jgi:hypothetical protein
VKIEISDVQRLVLKPGDRIIVRMPGRIDRAGAEDVERQVRARLELPGEVPVLVLPEGMSLEVVEPPGVDVIPLEPGMTYDGLGRAR